MQFCGQVIEKVQLPFIHFYHIQQVRETLFTQYLTVKLLYQFISLYSYMHIFVLFSVVSFV